MTIIFSLEKEWEEAGGNTSYL